MVFAVTGSANQEVFFNMQAHVFLVHRNH